MIEIRLSIVKKRREKDLNIVPTANKSIRQRFCSFYFVSLLTFISYSSLTKNDEESICNNSFTSFER